MGDRKAVILKECGEDLQVRLGDFLSPVPQPPEWEDHCANGGLLSLTTTCVKGENPVKSHQFERILTDLIYLLSTVFTL